MKKTGRATCMATEPTDGADWNPDHIGCDFHTPIICLFPPLPAVICIINEILFC